MHTEPSVLTRLASTALLLALALPFPVLADPSVTVNGVNLPHSAPFASTMVASSTALTDPWSVAILYDADQAAAPTARDGTPSYVDIQGNAVPFGNGTSQTVNDCGDGAATTWCFTYTPPAGIEAAVFWFFDISDAGGTYRFVLDTAGPILGLSSDNSTAEIDPIADNVPLPTISGSSSYGSALVDIYIAGAGTARTYQTTAAGGLWSYTLPAGDELPEGSYTVTASSTDQYNNRGAEVSGTFTIDTSAPAIAITSGPTDNGYASSSPVSFSFETTDATTTTTACSWDGAASAACSSPATSTLADGARTFSVTATDAYGNSATTTRIFTFDATAPVLTESAAIATSTNTAPEYGFTSGEAGALVLGGGCSTAATAAAAGANTITLDTLAVGAYNSCTVSVTDAAGNTGVLAISPFTIEAPPAAEPEPAPAPSGGGGGGGGVISGPLSVGYQIPYTPPLPPTAPAPEPQQVTVSAPAGEAVAVAPAPAPVPAPAADTIRVVPEVEAAPAPATESAPVAVTTPWDTPAGEQIHLAAAAAAAAPGFTLPAWLLLAAALLLALIGIIAWALRRR